MDGPAVTVMKLMGHHERARRKTVISEENFANKWGTMRSEFLTLLNHLDCNSNELSTLQFIAMSDLGST
jgi:hypothetical protein